MRLPATIYLIELTEITSKTRADESYTDDYEYLANFLYATFFLFFFVFKAIGYIASQYVHAALHTFVKYYPCCGIWN